MDYSFFLKCFVFQSEKLGFGIIPPKIKRDQSILWFGTKEDIGVNASFGALSLSWSAGVGARESAKERSLSQRESERLSVINFVWMK